MLSVMTNAVEDACKEIGGGGSRGEVYTVIFW